MWMYSVNTQHSQCAAHLNALLHRDLDLLMAVPVSGGEAASADEDHVSELLQAVDEEEPSQHQYLRHRHC